MAEAGSNYVQFLRSEFAGRFASQADQVFFGEPLLILV